MIWLLIFTIAVFIAWRAAIRLLPASRARGTAATIVARLPEGAVWKWGRGAWGLVLGPDLEKTLEPEVAEALLAVTWGVSDRADLERAEETMRDRAPEQVTWRQVRMIALVRLAVAGGVLDGAEGTKKLTELSSELTGRHAGWSALADAFDAEHTDFLKSPPPKEGGVVPAGLTPLPTLDHLKKARASLEAGVWPDLRWDMVASSS
jgi:hypothetical protein